MTKPLLREANDNSDPMAEDELDKIIGKFWANTRYTKDVKEAGNFIEAKAAINAYTTNKIIEARGGLDKPSPKQTSVATKSVSDTCTLCGASPMTANCNNAGCS
jgi:hypothetical protein